MRTIFILLSLFISLPLVYGQKHNVWKTYNGSYSPVVMQMNEYVADAPNKGIFYQLILGGGIVKSKIVAVKKFDFEGYKAKRMPLYPGFKLPDSIAVVEPQYLDSLSLSGIAIQIDSQDLQAYRYYEATPFDYPKRYQGRTFDFPQKVEDALKNVTKTKEVFYSGGLHKLYFANGDVFLIGSFETYSTNGTQYIVVFGNDKEHLSAIELY